MKKDVSQKTLVRPPNFRMSNRVPRIFRFTCSRHIRCGFSWQIHFTKTIFRLIAKPGCTSTSKLLHKIDLCSNFDVVVQPGFAINQKTVLVKCILRQKSYLMLRLQADLWFYPKFWDPYCLIDVITMAIHVYLRQDFCIFIHFF